MANVIPKLSNRDLRAIPSGGERKFYKACQEQLPEEILVIHSKEFITQPPGRKTMDGEVDFMLFDPRKGILLVEIKGGGVSLDAETGRWSSVDKKGKTHAIKNPFQQVKSQKYAIFGYLKESQTKFKNLKVAELMIEYAVFFPDVKDPSRLVSSERPVEIIGGSEHLDNLCNWVDRVFEFWSGGRQRFTPLGDKGVSQMKSIFCNSFAVNPLLATQLETEEKVRIDLTNQQANILKTLRKHKEAVICGGAGTGKTLLAMEKASQLTESGKRTLLICYNRPLGDFLMRNNQWESQLFIMSFHQLCEWIPRIVQKQTGIDLLEEVKKEHPGEDKYEEQLPLALSLAADELEEEKKFDAIIVDEGQDFLDQYWLSIELLFREENERIYYIFYDPNQLLYQEKIDLPIQSTPYCLDVNCRNTKYIHEGAYNFFEGEEVDPPENEGVPVAFLEAPSIKQQAKRLHQTIVKLLSDDKVLPQDIAILLPSKSFDPYLKCLPSLPLPKGVRYLAKKHWMEETILVETVARFKGLEAAVLFLWGVDELVPEEDKKTFYVALSRAKSRLYLVGTKHSCERVLAKH